MDAGTVTELTNALIAFREKAWGDSNDAEIEAAQDLASIVEDLLVNHGVDRNILDPGDPESED